MKKLVLVLVLMFTILTACEMQEEHVMVPSESGAFNLVVDGNNFSVERVDEDAYAPHVEEMINFEIAGNITGYGWIVDPAVEYAKEYTDYDFPFDRVIWVGTSEGKYIVAPVGEPTFIGSVPNRDRGSEYEIVLNADENKFSVAHIGSGEEIYDVAYTGDLIDYGWSNPWTIQIITTEGIFTSDIGDHGLRLG